LNDKDCGRGTAKRFVALALALAPTLAACTGEKSFILPLVDADDPSSRYDTVCAGWARRECTYTEACKPSVFAQWENDPQCLERETLACELQSSDPDVPFEESFSLDHITRVARFENGPTREWFNPVLVEVSPRGGHFTPVENPDAVVAGIRKTFRALRSRPPHTSHSTDRTVVYPR